MIRYAFFGTGTIARAVLEELAAQGLSPALIITAPDAPRGRGLALAPSPAAQFAESHGIPVWKPEKPTEVIEELRKEAFEVFAIADYGFILPRTLLELPPRGILNMHPSLLPKFRGPSPVRTAILAGDRDLGASVMLLDEQMDHGPILGEVRVAVPEWPPHALDLEKHLARAGGKLLAETLPKWLAGEIAPREQDHEAATYTKKFTKDDGRLDLAADPQENLRKVRALEGWPGTYAFFTRADKEIRAKVLDAHIDGGVFVIDTVVPEGKRPMPYADFLRSGAKPA